MSTDVGLTYSDINDSFLYLSEPITLTEAHLVLLGGLIGNLHPSHLNDEYSTRAGPFRQRVAHGELVHALMVSGLAHVLRSTSHGQVAGSYTLEAPVFVGDTIYTEITLKGKRVTRSGKRGLVSFMLRTFKQDGAIVALGTTDLLVGHDPFPIYSPATPAGSSSAP
ncbi:MAG: MaoC/PaaZ C-terminal domain-containing protein [Thermoleophilaceae bacterium]